MDKKNKIPFRWCRIFSALIFIAFFLPRFLFAETIELVFWNYWDPKLILPAIERFEAEHPGVKIKNEQVSWGSALDKILVSMANGKEPDICEMGSTWMGKFMNAGVLYPLGSADISDKYFMSEAVTWDDTLYGMPWLVSTRVLFYNKDLLEKAGIYSPPETWQELLYAAQKTNEPRKGIFGFGMNAGEPHVLYKKFMPFVWGNGGEILDEENSFVFNSKETAEALDFYKELQKYSYSEKQDFLDELFKRGKLALNISGSWNFSRYPKEAPNLNYDVALIPKPSHDKGYNASFLGGEVLTVFKTSKHPELAVEFVHHMTQIANSMPITEEAWLNFPADKAILKMPVFREEPKLNVFLKQMETAVHPPIVSEWVELERILNKTVERVMYGEELHQELFAAEHAAGALLNPSKAQPLSIGDKETALRTSSEVALLSIIVIFLIINALLLYFIIKNRPHYLGIGKLQKKNRILYPLHTMIFLSPWLIIFAVFWFYPAVFSFLMSFYKYDIFMPDLLSFTGFSNYFSLLKDREFLQALFNTVVFVGGTVPATTLLALVLAFMLSRLKSAASFFKSVFFFPSVISIVVVATIFKAFYSPFGLFNALLSIFGIEARAWLVEAKLALPAIMLMNIWTYTGYYSILFLAAFTSVPQELYESAELDGAGEWQKLRWITLPSIMPMTVLILIMNSIRTWQVFSEVFTLTGGGPLGNTNTLVHYLYQVGFRYHNMGYASAIGYVVAVTLMALAYLQSRLLRKKEALL